MRENTRKYIPKRRLKKEMLKQEYCVQETLDTVQWCEKKENKFTNQGKLQYIPCLFLNLNTLYSTDPLTTPGADLIYVHPLLLNKQSP